MRNGHYPNKKQRYKCKNCKRRFSDTTNRTTNHGKLTYDKLLMFFECMNDKLSIRETAARLEVNKNAIFAMRHKVLNSLCVFREDTELSGQIQLDEKYESINLKGMRKKKCLEHLSLESLKAVLKEE